MNSPFEVKHVTLVASPWTVSNGRVSDGGKRALRVTYRKKGTRRWKTLVLVGGAFEDMADAVAAAIVSQEKSQ